MKLVVVKLTVSSTFVPDPLAVTPLVLGVNESNFVLVLLALD